MKIVHDKNCTSTWDFCKCMVEYFEKLRIENDKIREENAALHHAMLKEKNKREKKNLS